MDGGLRPFLRKIVAHPCTDCPPDGLGFRVSGLGFRVYGLGFRAKHAGVFAKRGTLFGGPF